MQSFVRRVCVCVCVCVRESEREGHITAQCRVMRRVCVCVCVCVLACVREGDTVTQSQLVCKHIRASLLCRSRDSVPLSGLN